MPPSSNRGGIIVLVVLIVVVLLGGGGTGAYFLFVADDGEKGPVVDTSRDLAKAPMGCGLFTAAEIAPFIPGQFTTEPTIGGDYDFESSAQCMYSNRTVRADGQPYASLSIATRLHKAGETESGVERADAAFDRKPGTPAGVPGADKDKFREIESSRKRVTRAEISVLYRNVVVSIIYHHDALGEDGFAQPLLTLSALAVEKL